MTESSGQGTVDLLSYHRPLPAGAPPPSVGSRSFFPIPPLRRDPPTLGNRPNWWRRRRRHVRLMNGALRSVNWLAGFNVADTDQAQPHPSHDGFYGMLDGRVNDKEPRPVGYTPQAAFRELLAGRSDYLSRDPGSCVAPYNLADISWPSSASRAPLLVDMVGDVARRYLVEGEGERMLAEARELDATQARAKTGCHTDPRLGRSKRSMNRFLRDLQSRDLLNFTFTPKCIVGVFFVYKKCKKYSD